MFVNNYNRRKFLKNFTAASAGLSLNPASVFSGENNSPLVVMVKNGSIPEMIERALEPLGGMSAFIKKGQVVVVKPNMSWASRPEQGANTNPEVVAAVVKMAYQAGAGQVRVFDRTCNEKRRCYRMSGIENAAKKAGAKVYYVNDRNFKKIKIAGAKRLKSWEIYKDVLEADVLINVPTLKHHGLTRLTIGVKNLMGFMGGDRGKIHRHIDEKIIDFATIVKPNLTIIDATRVLLRNGPQGGSIRDVKKMDTIIASENMISADALAAGLMGVDSRRLGYLVEAEKRGMGIIDVTKMNILKIELK